MSLNIIFLLMNDNLWILLYVRTFIQHIVIINQCKIYISFFTINNDKWYILKQNISRKKLQHISRSASGKHYTIIKRKLRLDGIEEIWCYPTFHV